MSGVNGACNRACRLGYPHDIHCRNYIEVVLPCPVCLESYGRHALKCVIAPERERTDVGGSDA